MLHLKNMSTLKIFGILYLEKYRFSFVKQQNSRILSLNGKIMAAKLYLLEFFIKQISFRTIYTAQNAQRRTFSGPFDTV